ncbi:trehalase-like [Gastrolobium bilobum]|uniref:trehalase-like n=1 Tax=Gastrolobium bilobum TaxID=150636 RepID=UPI002AB0EA3D|nr:trehalase-like [Gastrolobium bilobum]
MLVQLLTIIIIVVTATGTGSYSVLHMDLDSTPLVSFLERLQEAAFNTFGLGVDPKTYVDMPLKLDLCVTEEAFDKLGRSGDGKVSVEELTCFIEEYFERAGDDMEPLEAEDFVEEPEGFLAKVEHPEVREWALKVHSLWNNLSRKMCNGVKREPHLHTLLPVPSPFIIPGSRFRELYYWDSYWVIRGLLVSKMYKTATGIVINLISLIEEYGFMPNGARVYYTNRSQPPLLSAMIYEIYSCTGDIDLVKRCLPALQKEYEFWNSEKHKVTILDAQGCTHTLNRYYAMWNKPRPEAFVKDKAFSSKLLDATEKQHFYRELASAAESGWDFSTRWMRDPSDFTTMATTSVIPVDLNAFLLGMELNIAFFAKVTGDNSTAEHFLELSDARKKAMNSVFWNEDMKQWLDSWLTNSTFEEAQVWESLNQNQKVFASNFIPLWMEPFYSDTSLVGRVVESLKTSSLVCAAGVATSLTNSGQQWDFPNGWAPLQQMLVEGLLKSGLKEARSLAEEIAVRWITTNYVAYKRTGVMHEKFDVEHCGKFGGGGLYAPQTGFGWSNGVVLAFLEEFGWPQDRNIDC